MWRNARTALALFPALALGAIAAPERVEALIDCDDPALQGLKLPDPANPGADGWTAAGPALKGVPPNPAGSTPEIAAGDQNGGPAQGTAQVFTQTVGTMKCFYLRRESPGGATANGVLCFDPSDCSVCAWDKKTTPPAADPKGTLFSDMLFASSYGNANGIDDCSACHVSGIAMPMDAMYQQIDEIDLMNECVDQGGVKWVGAPATWAQQNAANKVAPDDVPESCELCHTSGFLKPQANQQAWCDFAGQAFKEGGSMADYSEEECEEFMDAVTCNPAECSDLDVLAVPSVSHWGVVSLTALLAAATYLALRPRRIADASRPAPSTK